MSASYVDKCKAVEVLGNTPDHGDLEPSTFDKIEQATKLVLTPLVDAKQQNATDLSLGAELRSRTGVCGSILDAITKALEKDGATNVAALKSAPLHPDLYKETYKVLEGGDFKPVEKAMFKQSLTEMGESSSTDGAHTGVQQVKDAAAVPLQQLSELKALQEAFQPFIDKAADQEADAQAKQEAAEKKVVAEARAELLVLHGLQLPKELTAGAASRYLDREIGKLKLDALPQQPDLSVTDLVERNELMHCVHLHSTGADIAPSPVGQLHPNRSPFKNPRVPSYRLVDKDVETTNQHATMKQLDETVGMSWSLAGSTKGAAFVGTGVAAWSGSLSEAAAAEATSSAEESGSSGTITHVKVTQAILTCTQFSLADRDWELTSEFETSLEGLTTAASADDAEAKVLLFLEDYGSHLATQAMLGGKYKIECHHTDLITEGDKKVNKNVAAALDYHASAAAAYAGLGGTGTAGGSTSWSAHVNRQTALQEKGKDHHEQTMMSMVVTGGVPGDLTAWLNDLRKSNRGWAVVDRSPVHGLRPIWDLVHKSKQLSPTEKTDVSDKIKRLFHKKIEYKVWEAAINHGVNNSEVEAGCVEIICYQPPLSPLSLTLKPHHDHHHHQQAIIVTSPIIIIVNSTTTTTVIC